ncbi:648_t:CDS:2, partial [Ambispora gerdemannii]
NDYELDENSQDSYTSDPDMATIAELANTIDDYLNNSGTNRTILSNQIKRVTRQIHYKYNNLQTDLKNEQQQRYNAEAEQDICQTELTQTQGDLNLITTTYNNERVVCQQYFLELQQLPQMIALETDNACDFNDAVKYDVLKSKIEGKFAPVPANAPYTHGNPAINTPAILWGYLNIKYQRETIGSQQSAIQRLTQERFQSYDTLDSYKAKI